MSETNSTTLATACVESPIGTVAIAASSEGVIRVNTGGRGAFVARDGVGAEAARQHADAAAEALAEYFAGTRRAFDDLILAPRGSAFQLRVWAALREIPFGATESYGALADRIGEPGAARAVGLANHDNPIGIIVPCHRVIGADGSLVGFAGGLDRKRWLLGHEGALSLPMFPVDDGGRPSPSR